MKENMIISQCKINISKMKKRFINISKMTTFIKFSLNVKFGKILKNHFLKIGHL